MRMMKKICLLMLLLVLSFQTKAQTKYEFKIDTMYSITLSYYPYKLPPQKGSVFVKDLSNYNICLDSYNTMVNSFYNNAFFMLGLYFEFSETYYSLYKDSTEETKTKIANNVFNKIIDCNKCLIKTDRIYLDDSTYVVIEMEKVVAKFYKEPIENKIFSSQDLEYDFKNYKYNYFYRFIDIFECTPADRNEIKTIYTKGIKNKNSTPNISPEKIKEMIIDIYSIDKDSLLVSYNKSSIPKSLKKELKKKFSNFRIANPNCEYRKTDVIRNSSLPNKQLVFLINNGDYYSLVFRLGGRAHSTYFVFSKKESNKVKILGIYSISNKVTTIDEFIKEISIGKFSIVSYL